MAMPKHTAKKQNKEQTLQKRVAKRPDIERVAAVATLTYKLTSLTPNLKNMTGLWQNEQLKNKE